LVPAGRRAMSRLAPSSEPISAVIPNSKLAQINSMPATSATENVSARAGCVIHGRLPAQGKPIRRESSHPGTIATAAKAQTVDGQVPNRPGTAAAVHSNASATTLAVRLMRFLPVT